MLPRSNRLKKQKDIKRVLEKGKRYKEDFLILKATPNHLEATRFGFIVSQKFSKKAALRNKMKRKLREIVRLRFQKIKKGMDALVIVLPGLENKDFWEVDEALEKLLKKAKILKQETRNKREKM